MNIELGMVGIVTTGGLDDKIAALTHDPKIASCIKAMIEQEKADDRADAVQILKDNGMEIAAMLIRRV